MRGRGTLRPRNPLLPQEQKLLLGVLRLCISLQLGLGNTFSLAFKH